MLKGCQPFNSIILNDSDRGYTNAYSAKAAFRNDRQTFVGERNYHYNRV